jgi:hypothetical protein
MPPRHIALCALIGFAVVTPVSRAEVPVLRPNDLKQQSTHIVVGKITTLYRSVEPGTDFEQTRGIAEILIDKVEKGAGPKAGEVLFVRFWNQRWVGKGDEVPPHSGGHHVPDQGKTVRAYLTRGKDGSYEVLLPNGLAVVAEPAPRSR